MLELIGQIVGGVGLFLIGTELLRSGFEESAGHSLRRILSDFTDRTSKGILAGFIVSSAVQSATAVIFTLIGFVNARLLQLKQAVAVVYGANLGKITIVLLITALGFKFSIASYALPILGFGSFLKIFLKNRRAGLATALMGFGLIFLGIATLKTSIVLINHEIDLRHVDVPGQKGLLIYFLAGVLLTIVTQSSTSAMVLTMSALSAGIFSLENAIALVIGENFGTTSSSLLASVGTSPSAKRLSGAHVIYNFVSTVIGIAVLEIFVLSGHFDSLLEWANYDKTLVFSFFYSFFMFVTLLVMLPLKPRLVDWLDMHFHNAKALGSPKFIDHGKVYHPVMAVQALHSEILRFGKVASEMLDTAMKWTMKNGWVYTVDLSYEEKELDRLSEYIHWFVSRTARKQSSAEVVKSMQVLSMASRHFETVSDLSQKITKLKGKMTEPLNGCDSFKSVCEWTENVRTILKRLDEPLKSGDLKEVKTIDAEFSLLEEQKVVLRQNLLNAGVSKQMSSSQTIILIDLVDSCRRAIRDQFRGIYETWEIKNVIESIPTGTDNVAEIGTVHSIK
jgi:phosphate:Na+ symporter